MTVKALLAEGQLDSALAAVEAMVRKNPLDYRNRTTLFALCCFVGDLNRAEQQLTVLSQESEESAEGTAVYQGLLKACRVRERVMRGEIPGRCLLNEPPYAESQRQAIRHIARGDLASAQEALQDVAQKRPPCPMQTGELVGQVRDADDRVGPFAELFVQDEYVWLPWEQIRTLRVTRPVHLRDLLWAPVVVELDAGPLQAFMPVLYPESSAAVDPLVRLGRVTVFAENPLGLSIGQGARLIALEASSIREEEAPPQDLPLFELGSLVRLDLRAGSDAEKADDAELQVIQEAV